METETVILKLLKETQKGELAWKRCNPESGFSYLFRATDDQVDAVFYAEKSGQHLALYEQKYRHFTDEDVFFWSSRYCLDVVSSSGEMLWQFPGSQYLSDLYSAAQYSAANVPSILDALMS
jgi:hypothetical protein